MALPTINLDDRSYAQLLAVLRSHIPGEEWSDHNPSDPGIALLELLTWLGEMSLYRMNRIPQAHRDKFLKLLADPPAPVTVALTLKLGKVHTVDPTIPPGLRFATDYKDGERHVFESFAAAVLTKPADASGQQGVVHLRAVRDVTSEVLGVSDGAPDQVFRVAQGPILVDFATPTANPVLMVGSDTWELRPFLRSPASYTPNSPAAKHFMVDTFTNEVRFGDGVYAAIPPAGATIMLAHYQVLEDRRALVAAGAIKHVLNPQHVSGLAPDNYLVIVSHKDAQGGEKRQSAAERQRRALAGLRASSRLVTAEDFERVATTDFNAFQRDFNAAQGLAPDKLDVEGHIGRAVALMNRKTPLALNLQRPGHVTLIVLPRYDEVAFEHDSYADKQLKVAVSPALNQRLTDFLDPHRLITTRVHIAGVDLKPVSISLVAFVDPQRNRQDMEAAVLAALRAHLSLVRGYDGRGWPLGRPVRRSHLYDVLEGLAGMDHVEDLKLTPANSDGDVELLPQELPVWDVVNVQVKR